MKQVIRNNIDNICNRLEELNVMLADPEIIIKQNKFRELSKERANLVPLFDKYTAFKKLEGQLFEVRDMLKDNNKDIREMAKLELIELEKELFNAEQKINTLLLPKDELDDANVYLELRAGTGGNEAAIFAGDLLRMYIRYSERQNWRVEIINVQDADYGGYKEAIIRIEGKGVYSKLKFESGVHRVQRVPETESQGRVHTSATTVAILPESENIEEIEINPKDLRIDTFRASGAGGQHVNKTDSAIRITHIPTGTVVECQDERSQHKNKARAMSILGAKLLDKEIQARNKMESERRKSLVGSGDRSQRIRTYNFPQGRVTDHRINLTLYSLSDFIEGNIDNMIDILNKENQSKLLANLEQNY